MSIGSAGEIYRLEVGYDIISKIKVVNTIENLMTNL